MGGDDALPAVRQRGVRPQPLPPSCARHERPSDFDAITVALPAAAHRGRRRLLPRPLPGDRPRAGGDLDRDGPAGPQRRRASAPSPAAAGTILNNLVALGVGRIVPVGFCGDDGEGYELRRELAALPGVRARSLPDHARAPDVHLLQAAGRRARPRARRAEPARLQELDADARRRWCSGWPTGCARSPPRSTRSSCWSRWTWPRRASSPAACSTTIGELAAAQPEPADPGRLAPRPGRLAGAELQDERRRAGRSSLGQPDGGRCRLDRTMVKNGCPGALARRNGRPVFVTLAERGIVGGRARRPVEHVPALPVRGPDRHRRRRRRRHGEPGRRPLLRRLAPRGHRAGRRRFVGGHPSARHNRDRERGRPGRAGRSYP